MGETKFINYGLYTIDIDYIKYLYSFDNEVFYDSNRPYSSKPYIGILVGLSDKKYFIPLTSAKKKHETWELRGEDHILIYEQVKIISKRKGEYYKDIKNNLIDTNHILASIMISKMIPVLEGLYTNIDIGKINDFAYRNLLMKELAFCNSNQQEIIQRAEKAYSNQMNTGKIIRYFVNFSLLEKKSEDYKN